VKRPAEILDVLAHPRRQRALVEAVDVADLGGALKGLACHAAEGSTGQTHSRLERRGRGR
jgi:hypothetical protein